MKRYTPREADTGRVVEWPDEDPQGEWVRYETARQKLAELQAAAQQALAVLEDLDECEMARLRGRGDFAIKALRSALEGI